MKIGKTVPALAAVATLAISSCSTTAGIQRLDGPDNETTIEGSDANALYVRGTSGRTYRLDRSQVGDIDHPGNVAVAVGASLVATGLLLFAATTSNTRSERIGLASFYGVPGLGLMLSGGYFYARSKHAARSFEDRVGPVEQAPSSPMGASLSFSPAAARAWQSPPPPLVPTPPAAAPPPEPVTTRDAGSD
jgi:hypothetical protein